LTAPSTATESSNGKNR